jgi:hypothetical protein
MNFEILQGDLTDTESKDIQKMLRIGSEIAFKNEQSYKVQDKHGDIKTIKIGTKRPPKGYVYRNVKVLFNFNKKIVA